MKPAKGTPKKASAKKAPKTPGNVNLAYVEQITDESISTLLALRALIGQLVLKLEDKDNAA
jgi:hypothetical protein